MRLNPHIGRLCCVALLVLVSASAASASVVLTDLFHQATGGGVWNDDASQNWGIWVAPGTDPTLTVAADFLNPGNPVNNTNIVIPDGVSSYLLFKNQCCGGGSVSDVLKFGANTLDLLSSLGAYHTANDAPSLNGASTTAGGYTVKVVSFSWYNPDVFNVDLIGQGQTFAPGSGTDDIGKLTLQVTAVPEPSTIALLAIGCVAFWARRRRLA
jgi:PEP-CTERM motif